MNFLVVALAVGALALTLAAAAPSPQDLFTSPSRQIVTTNVPYVLKEYPALRTSVARIIDNVNQELQKRGQELPKETQHTLQAHLEKQELGKDTHFAERTQPLPQVAQPNQQTVHHIPHGVPEEIPQLFLPVQHTTPAIEPGTLYPTTLGVHQETPGVQKVTPTPTTISQTTPFVQQTSHIQIVPQVSETSKLTYPKAPSVQIIGKGIPTEQTVSQIQPVTHRPQVYTEVQQSVSEGVKGTPGVQHIFLSQSGQQTIQKVPTEVYQTPQQAQQVVQHISQGTETYQTPQQAQQVVQHISQEQKYVPNSVDHVSQGIHQPTESTQTIVHGVQQATQIQPAQQKVSQEVHLAATNVKQTQQSTQHTSQGHTVQQISEQHSFNIHQSTPSVKHVGQRVQYIPQDQYAAQGVQYSSQYQQVQQKPEQTVSEIHTTSNTVPQESHIVQQKLQTEPLQQNTDQVSENVYQSTVGVQQSGQDVRQAQSVQQTYQTVYQPAVAGQQVGQTVQYVLQEKQPVQQATTETYQPTKSPESINQNEQQTQQVKPTRTQIKQNTEEVYQATTVAPQTFHGQDVQQINSQNYQATNFPILSVQHGGAHDQVAHDHADQHTNRVIQDQQVSQEVYQATQTSQNPTQNVQHVFWSHPVQLRVQPFSSEIYQGPHISQSTAQGDQHFSHGQNVQQESQRTVFGTQQEPQDNPQVLQVEQKIQQETLQDHHPVETAHQIFQGGQQVYHISPEQQASGLVYQKSGQQDQQAQHLQAEPVLSADPVTPRTPEVSFTTVNQNSREKSGSANVIQRISVDVPKAIVSGQDVPKKLAQAPQVTPGVPQVLQVISHGVKPIVHAALQASHGFQLGSTVHHDAAHSLDGTVLYKSAQAARSGQSVPGDIPKREQPLHVNVHQLRTPTQDAELAPQPAITEKGSNDFQKVQEVTQSTRTVDQEIGHTPHPIAQNADQFTQGVLQDIHRIQQGAYQESDAAEAQDTFESLRTPSDGHSYPHKTQREKAAVPIESPQLQQVLRQVQQVRQEIQQKQESQRVHHPYQEQVHAAQENRQLPQQQEAHQAKDQRQQYQQYQAQFQQEYEGPQNQRGPIARPQFNVKKPVQSASPTVTHNQIFDNTFQRQPSRVEDSRIESAVEANSEEIYATPEPVPILRYENSFSPDGSYQWSYESGNGIRAQEAGELRYRGDPDKESYAVQGGYSYTGPDGVLYAVEYIADENGFQPQGRHLPTQPPLPEALKRAIDAHMAILATAQPEEEPVDRPSEDGPLAENGFKTEKSYAKRPFSAQ